MSKIAIIGEIRGKVTGSGYRELNHNMRTVADVWTAYTGTAIAAAKQLAGNENEEVSRLASIILDAANVLEE